MTSKTKRYAHVRQYVGSISFNSSANSPHEIRCRTSRPSLASPVNSPTRRELEVEALGISAALENGVHGDEDTAEQLFAHSQTIANTLHKLHEDIQTIA